jgi:Fe2+ transport system protein FeoA
MADAARSAALRRDDAPVRLSELAAGRAARLERRELSEGEACLLAAMGLTEGCRMVVRVLGDPCIVEVRTTRIGLARSVAERLYVRAERPESR